MPFLALQADLTIQMEHQEDMTAMVNTNALKEYTNSSYTINHVFRVPVLNKL